MLQIKKAQTFPDQTGGLNIQAHLRDLLMSEASMPITQAQQIADMFAQTVQTSNWLELSSGLTFERKFDPSNQFSETEQQTGVAGPGETVNPLSHIVP